MSPGVATHRIAGACVAAILLAAVSPATSVAGQRVWVFQPPNQIVAIDAADFSRGTAVTIPPEACEDPRRLIVNSSGQMLVKLDDDRVWLWTGVKAESLPANPPGPPVAPRPGVRFESASDVFLGADGRSVFYAVNEGWTSVHADEGGDSLISTRARLVRVDFAGRAVETLLDHEFAACECATGACSETCPQGVIVAPRRVLGGYFEFIHFVEGQIGSTWGPAYYCRIGVDGSSAVEIANDLSRDGFLSGPTGLHVEDDAGCCGAINGSSDRVVWVGSDTTTTLYDEWSEFHNPDYEASFGIVRAGIAPGAQRVAIGIQSVQGAGSDLEVTADGHDDALELAAVRRSLAELPLVQVYTAGRRAALIRRLPHEEFADWISADELLVVENGRLVAIDVTNGKRRESSIRVRGAADVILPGTGAN